MQGGTWTAYYGYGYGNALYRRNSEYPLYDGHGSERTVTDASQNVTGTLNLDAFGNLAGSTGSSSNPYMYCGAFGYRNDADAGLALVGARYYDYQVGRFVTRDTYLDQHPYLYCEHDPVNAVDPTGHDGLIEGIVKAVIQSLCSGGGAAGGGFIGGTGGALIGGATGTVVGILINLIVGKFFTPPPPPPPTVYPPGWGLPDWPGEMCFPWIWIKFDPFDDGDPRKRA
jgi:RHS repeat-associated protein